MHTVYAKKFLPLRSEPIICAVKNEFHRRLLRGFFFLVEVLSFLKELEMIEETEYPCFFKNGDV